MLPGYSLYYYTIDTWLHLIISLGNIFAQLQMSSNVNRKYNVIVILLLWRYRVQGNCLRFYYVDI